MKRLAGLAVVAVLALAGTVAACVRAQDLPPDLAFVSDRDGDPEIYTIRADGRGLRKLTDNRFADTNPPGHRVATASPSRATGTGTRSSTSWTPTAAT